MDSNDEMVDYLKRQGRIKSRRVETAFRKVDRAGFVPESRKSRAYRDTPLPLEEGSTISAPHMVAENTELLEVEEDSRVLEIGSGSGYQLAILAELTGAEVVGVERLEPLVERSKEALEPGSNTRVIHGSGLGDVGGEFDRILYSCAVESMEDAKKRLAEDGIILAPVMSGKGQMLTKYRDGETTEHWRVRFVPFIED